VIKDIFIGVDGGATKCKTRIETADGELLGMALGGAANIRLSVPRTWQAIYESINEILAPHSMTLQDKNFRYHAGFGLAGCEVKEAHDSFLNTPHPFASLRLCTDAHAACIGAHDGKDGAIIIIGTGVVGYQIHADVIDQVGGWGFPHDDEGGGAWLGLEVARMTFQWLDERAEQTPLLAAVFAYFDNDMDHFVTWANRATSNEFAKLAPLVIQHSALVDPAAQKLMQQAANAINQVGQALQKKSARQAAPLPCCLFGGIAPFIEPWLAEDLRARIVPRQGDANIGAVILARQLASQQQAAPERT
jgi:glucosamine kinase